MTILSTCANIILGKKNKIGIMITSTHFPCSESGGRNSKVVAKTQSLLIANLCATTSNIWIAPCLSIQSLISGQRESQTQEGQPLLQSHELTTSRAHFTKSEITW